MKRYFALSFLVCLLCISSCQRDDICPETTQTTPKLVIEFFNFEDVDQPKDVRRLNVVAEGDVVGAEDPVDVHPGRRTAATASRAASACDTKAIRDKVNGVGIVTYQYDRARKLV